MKNTLILGSTSDVGIACAHRFASNNSNLILASRKRDESTDSHMNDLRIRYSITVEHVVFDALKTQSHKEFVEEIHEKFDTVVSVFGVLGNHEKALTEFTHAEEIVQTNLNGNISVLGLIANYMELNKTGTIACVSSVAGERGRMSNYIYGASKAGLTTFLSGLRNRLAHSNVHVATINPGFIKTKMIGDLETPAPLTASAEEVAECIFKACKKKKNTTYVKSIWRLIMFIIRTIPEFVFKKLKL